MPITVRMLSPERIVNTTLAGDQRAPQQVFQADGSSLVVWTEFFTNWPFDPYNGSVYAQAFDAVGAPIGQEQRISEDILATRNLSLTALSSGGYLLSFENTTLGDIEFQRFAADGSRAGGVFSNASAGSAQGFLQRDVLLTADGSYAISSFSTYSILESTGNYRAYDAENIGFYNIDGSVRAQNNEIVSPNFTRYGPLIADLFSLNNGRTLALTQGADGFTTAAQFFSASGSPEGLPFLLNNADGSPLLPDWQRFNLSVTSLADGGFAIAYFADVATSATDFGIRLQRYDAVGQAVSNPFVIPSNGQSNPPTIVEFIELNDASFAVIRYFESSSVSAELLDVEFYSATGQLQVGPIQVFSSRDVGSDNYHVSAMPDGGLSVTWSNFNAARTDYDIFQRTIPAPAELRSALTSLTEIVAGTTGNDVILANIGGLNAGDQISGNAGIDTIRLTSAGLLDANVASLTSIERLEGSSGDDVIRIGAGTIAAGLTVVDGGAGNDALEIIDAALPTFLVLQGSGIETVSRSLTDASNSQTYASIRETYDLNWQILSRQRVNDNGTTVSISYDYTSGTNYTLLVQEFNSTGARSVQRTYYDLGGYQFYYFDVAGATSWREFSDEYNAAGARTLQRIYNYDGSYRFFYWDAAGQNSWQTFDDEFNAAGQRHTERIAYDNGTTRLFYWDVTSSNAWTTFDEEYTSSGVRSVQRIQNDDGTSSQQFWDTGNTQSYSSYVDYMNAAGQRLEQRIFHDQGANAGGHTRLYFDPAGAFSWSTITETYDANGVRLSQIVVAD